MEIIAKSTYLKISPRKLRLIVNEIKKLTPLEALEKLKFINKRGKTFLINVLRQGIANAKNNFQLLPENLLIKEILVNEGPRLKRIDKSHSARFNRGIKQKRMSHLRLILKAKEERREEDKGLEKSLKEEKNNKLEKVSLKRSLTTNKKRKIKK